MSDNLLGDLVIRSDGGSRMGEGHLMRCLALAQDWQAEGGQVVFLSHCESEALCRRITDMGMEFIPIAQPHPASQDLQTTLEVLREHPNTTIGNWKSEIKNNNWLVLDGYHFNPAYQQAVQSAGFRLLVIDDMAHLPVYHADIILNQNLGAEKLKYNCNPDALLLLGSRYALLRQEFMRWRGWRRKIPETVRKVLVTMGGGDPDNSTMKVIRALQGIDIPDLEVKVVVGSSNLHIQELQSATSPQPAGASGPLAADGAIQNLPCVVPWRKNGQKSKINILYHPPNMSELMAWADVAVTAGGSTCWELAFMGLPSVVLVLAENQRPIAEGVNRAGIALNIGWHDRVSDDDIIKGIEKVMKDEKMRVTMSIRGQKLVDGEGRRRVIGEFNRM